MFNPEVPRRSASDAHRAVRIAVVIPSYRVSCSIADVIRAVPPLVNDIVVVDDGCPESSGDVAEGVGDPRVVVVRHARNRGVGGATKSGFRHALDLGAAVVVKVDGDGQIDPTQVPRIIRPLLDGTTAYAKGNRFWHLSTLSQMPPLRRLGNLGLSFLTKAASGHWGVFDPTNGFIAARGDVLRQLDLDSVSEDYFFEASMLIELGKWGFKVTDVPMPSSYGDENSSLSIGHALWTFPFKLLAGGVTRVWCRHFWYDFTVTALLLLAGVPLSLWGLGYGLSAWALSISTGAPATAGTVMLSALPFLLGVNCLLYAMSFEVGGNLNTRVSVDPSSPLDSGS
jgi:glycosyltransferase involved in cell wall biosynthesis